MLGLVWEQRSGGDVSGRTVVGGKLDKDESPRTIHVARVVTDEVVKPGFVAADSEAACVADGENEEIAEEYDLLLNPDDVELDWVPASAGDIPSGAVVAGRDDCDNKVFVARAVHEDNVVSGGIAKGTDFARIPSDGAVHQYEEYQVLCAKVIVPENA